MENRDEEGENVKSTAIVKYAAVKSPAKYAELQSNTDLNLPPANWLRKIRGLGGLGTLDVRNLNEFTSFHMANNFPDYIGEVDVVSDAENIKKLLKIPYSRSQVSMLVHRIGKTILMDEFDIHLNLRAPEKSSEWLKKFYTDHILQSLRLKEKGFLRKNKSRYHLKHKSMFSKFLYHSIADMSDSPVAINCATHLSDQLHMTEEQEAEHNRSLYGDHKFLRDVLWTFEDITMLIGTDMPIFGGGTHPCVSLRLRDKNKPINILTGLDYWLDNLMCNVPEIIMCYHLNGIVQQYELLKTEDIPQLDNCNFSPKVIKDVAQNILSFLKSNATKAGHTYWLFKGKDDDAVKLYDLTTLCSNNLMEDKGTNPFAIHVAVLFYTLARNLHAQRFLSNKDWATIHFLLKNCIRLLEDTKTPHLTTSAQFLLADLFVPNTSEVKDLNSDENCVFGADFVLEEPNTNSQNCDDEVAPYRSPSVEVQSLRVSSRRNRMNTDENALIKRKLITSHAERCKFAWEHIVKGLICINENKENWASNSHSDVEEVKRARPFEPIPLKYSPLNSKPGISDSRQRLRGCNLCGKNEKNYWMSFNHQPNCPLISIPWQVSHKLHLLEKGGIALYYLAQDAFNKENFGTALRYLQMVCMCLEGIESLIATCESFTMNVHLMPNCLALAGDVHFMLAKFHGNSAQHIESFKIEPDGWETLRCSTPQEDLCFNTYQSFWQVDTSEEEHLILSTRCYEEALSFPNSIENNNFKQRLGNAFNELGVMHMNKAKMLHDESGNVSNEIRTLWIKSNDYLNAGIEAFTSVHDHTNVALLRSNLGKLMRLRAHCEAPKTATGRGEFNQQERKYFQKALNYYTSAFSALEAGAAKDSLIWSSITWDYSTTLFTMATLLQDFAPLSSKSQQEVEDEVVSLLSSALKFCESDTNGSRQLLYQFRAANIHHRLASLYHHSVRNQMTDNEHQQKQMRLMAEQHYEKASELFATLERVSECLRVQLEHIGMHEFLLHDKVSGPSRVKLLKHILRLIVKTETVLTIMIQSSKDNSVTCKDDEDEDDQMIKMKFISILKERLNVVLLSLIKANKSNTSQIELYKKLYSLSLKGAQKENITHLVDCLREIKELAFDSKNR